ncbi:MAG: hydrogenase iron-sulfur subunit [Candidatus Eisenbacteria bacterium]
MTQRSPKTGATRPPVAPHDPRVLVFACNWCSYAGADTAGVSRLPQTPHFRLLRVMCSGRVHPAHVLRAFRQGADGVMVSGCHFGDCHYLFGNHRAAEQFERTRALAGLLGLEPERVHLEWISAAEGSRFAETMNDFVAQVRRAGPSPIAPRPAGPGTAAGPAPADAGCAGPARPGAAEVFACLECGRCSAVCPVARHQRFSPRRLITRALSASPEALAQDASLWACLTCYGCEAVCPVRIDYGRFILSARAEAVRSLSVSRCDPVVDTSLPPAENAGAPATDERAGEGGLTPCSHGGVFREISLIASRPGLRQQRLTWLEEDQPVEVLAEGDRAQGTDLFYVGCSPYFAAYFAGDTGAGLTASLRAAVRLLNRVSIRPALLANERCCGYHLRLAGMSDEAEDLALAVAGQIRASGAKRVITYCPECLVALRDILSRHKVDCTLAHLSQVLGAERQSLGRAVDEDAARPRVTYQDPCRLGRYVGVYERPRQLLTEVAGAELLEMAHHGEGAICCGNTGWLNCNAATKRFQTARLEEAAATGTQTLITACPGCYLHLRCAREGLTEGPAAAVEIVDLWSFVERGLPASRREIRAAVPSDAAS